MTDWIKITGKAVLAAYNAFVPRLKPVEAPGDDALLAVRERARRRTDISDHLETLYRLALDHKAGLVVELGVRSGESSFVLEKAVRQTGGWLISVDLEETDFASDYSRWHFIRMDDRELAARFAAEMKQRGAPGTIDFLFLDTSHTYADTVEELAVWMPLLSKRAIVALHDTNMATIFRRKDGSLGGGWNNNRGVIRALQEYLGVRWDEKQEFAGTAGEFRVNHVPWCSGLTVLYRGTD